MKTVKIYLTSLLLFTSLLVAAQKNNEDCKELLTKYIQKVASMDFPKGKEVYYLDMTVITHSRDQTKNSNVRSQLYLGSKQMLYESDKVSGYQDEKNAFMVVHPQKTILWANGGMRPDASLMKNVFGKFQDTLIKVSTVKSCQETMVNGRKVQKIVLEPSKKFKDYARVDRMEYTVDLEQQKLSEVTLYYLTGEEFISKTIVYHQINWHAKMDMSVGVYYRIFNTNNKFHKKYANYTLVDNRK